MPLEVFLQQARQIGEVSFEAGAKIAEVELHPEVSLNYLIDAMKNGTATYRNVRAMRRSKPGIEDRSIPETE